MKPNSRRAFPGLITKTENTGLAYSRRAESNSNFAPEGQAWATVPRRAIPQAFPSQGMQWPGRNFPGTALKCTSHITVLCHIEYYSMRCHIIMCRHANRPSLQFMIPIGIYHYDLHTCTPRRAARWSEAVGLEPTTIAPPLRLRKVIYEYIHVSGAQRGSMGTYRPHICPRWAAAELRLPCILATYGHQVKLGLGDGGGW